MSSPRDPLAEIDGLKTRLDKVELKFAKDLAAAMQLAQSNADATITSNFEAVKAYLSANIGGIRTDVQRLATAEEARVRAEAASAVRKQTALEQEAERLRLAAEQQAQEERRLAIEEKKQDIEKKRLENASGQFAVLDLPKESKHRRRIPLYTLFGIVVTALAGSGFWSLLSHH